MIKIKYSPTYEFTSLDIFDYADSEPVIYEAHARQPSEWAEMCNVWIKAGMKDTDQAIKIVATALVSVSQDGEKYPLDSIEAVEALRDSVEADNPGYGDQFIKHLALGHWNYHFRRRDQILGNFDRPSALSADGSSPGKSNGATKRNGK